MSHICKLGMAWRNNLDGKSKGNMMIAMSEMVVGQSSPT